MFTPQQWKLSYYHDPVPLKKDLLMSYIFFHFIYFSVYRCFAYVCVYTSRSCSAFKSQKRVLDSTGFDLQTALSHHVSAGSWTWVIWKSSQCSFTIALSFQHRFILNYMYMYMSASEYKMPMEATGVHQS